MWGRVIDPAWKAGRHFLQLVRGYVLIRILLFLLVCGGLFLAGSNGLGQQPQAITAFSSGKGSNELRSGFQEIKGLKKAKDFQGLGNPFGSGGIKERHQPRTSTHKDKPRERATPPMSLPADKEGAGSRKTTGRTPEPVLCGILGGEREAALLEYQGRQCVIYPGETLGSIQVEEIGADRIIVKTPLGRRVLVLYKGSGQDNGD